MKKNAVRVALHKRSVHFLHLKKIHETPSPPPASALPSPSLPPMPITSGPLPFSSGACAIASATAASSSGRGRLRCCCRPQPRRPSRRHRWRRQCRRRHFPPPQSPSSVGRPTSHVASPASLSLPPPWPHRCRRRRAWPSRARQFTPRRPRRACQLLAQECRHRRARQRFARLTLPSPCMLATCPPSPSPRVAIASAMIHMPSPSPRATATRPTSPSPRAGDSPVVAFAVAPATAPRTQDYPLPRGEVNKKYIHMPQGYF